MSEYPAGTANSSTFAPTRWTMVLAAAKAHGPGADSRQAHEALEALCRIYWYPLYAFVRRSGQHAADAEDSIQEFFTRLLSKDGLATVDRHKGRFRSFLLAAMKNFLTNEWHRVSAQKRGGGKPVFSLDVEAAESQLGGLEDDLTPEKIFDRQWAVTLLHEVLETLRLEMRAAGKAELFEELKEALTRSDRTFSYAQIAARLGMTEGAVKVTVYRLRRRYAELLREHVAQTVANPAEVEAELRGLFSACRG